MRVISKKALSDFWTEYPESKAALQNWYKKTTKAEWNSFADVKQTFNSVDNVGNSRYVFNIKGNNFRLVVIVIFKPQKVYVRFIGTHAEYDNIKNIQRI